MRWPTESLITLKRSRSRNSTAKRWRGSREKSAAPGSRRCSRKLRFGNPVNAVVQCLVLQLALDPFAHRDMLSQVAVGRGQFAGTLGHALLEFRVGLLEGFGAAFALERIGDVI